MSDMTYVFASDFEPRLLTHSVRMNVAIVVTERRSLHFYLRLEIVNSMSSSLAIVVVGRLRRHINTYLSAYSDEHTSNITRYNKQMVTIIAAHIHLLF